VTVTAGPKASPGGGPVAGAWLRRASGGDRAALEAMFPRCTPQTVYRRFHGPVKAFPASYLTEALAGVREHRALVAVAGAPAAGDPYVGGGCAASDPHAAGAAQGARVVALASCRLTGAGDAAELGLLVEDAWQGRGIGRELLRRLVEYADGLKVGELQAQTLMEQDWIIGMLRPYGHCSSVFRPGVREVRVQRARRQDPVLHASPAPRAPGRTGA
jgi:GNAT superfamily N-acetyltransferase